MKVIWLIISGLRADHLGAYGNRWLPMKELGQLADAGRVFSGARISYADALTTRMEWLTGLKHARFADLHESFINYRGSQTLPSLLANGGFKTALFTDNFLFLPIYERLATFDSIIFVPGQGTDRHLPDNFVTTSSLDRKKHSEIITGCKKLPPEDEILRFYRNRANDAPLRPPAERLFDAAGHFLDSLDPDENWFILIDAFGLAPPWSAPAEFTRFRHKEDMASVAWPLPGAIDLNDDNVRAGINFLRRTYADCCLYLDSLIENLSRRIMTYFDSQPFRFFVLSDGGTLIGDDGFLLTNPSQDHPAFTRQVLIALGHDIDDHSKSDQPISPVDLFTTTVEKTGLPNPPASDGQVIEDL